MNTDISFDFDEIHVYNEQELESLLVAVCEQ